MGKRRFRFVARCLALLAWAAAGSAGAATLRAEGELVVAEGEAIDDDLYAAGGNVRVDGDVRGDLIVAGGDVFLAGRVDGDVLVLGGDITLAGPVGGAVRVCGGTVRVQGSIQEDLVGAAGNLQVESGATIGRDAVVAGGELEVAGRTGRSLRAAAGELRITGEVAGPVWARAERVVVGDKAVIAGDLRYGSSEEAAIAPGARIGGQTVREPIPERGRGAGAAIFSWFRALVGLFVLGLLFVWLFPRTSRGAAQTLPAAPGASLGYGALALFLGPLAAVLVVVIGAVVGGWWIGLFLLALYAILVTLAIPVVALFLGRAVLGRVSKGERPWVLQLLVGTVLLLLAFAIPFAGPVVVLAVLLLGLGALARTLRSGRGVPPRSQPVPESPVT